MTEREDDDKQTNSVIKYHLKSINYSKHKWGASTKKREGHRERKRDSLLRFYRHMTTNITLTCMSLLSYMTVTVTNLRVQLAEEINGFFAHLETPQQQP